MDLFRKILVPTDFEDVSRHALDVALLVAQKLDASVTLFHAYRLPATPYVEGLAWPLQDFEAAARTMLDAELTRARQKYPTVNSILGVGGPGVLTVEQVKEGGYDLIVMGTHGRRGVSRMLMGSVAERVVRTSPVPVMTVPPP